MPWGSAVAGASVRMPSPAAPKRPSATPMRKGEMIGRRLGIVDRLVGRQRRALGAIDGDGAMCLCAETQADGPGCANSRLEFSR
jgi:hypothetical protein